MRGQENEFDGDEEVSEEQMEQLYNERLEEVEVQIEQDEHPPEPETDQQPERKKLKRELQAEALIRLEDAARTQDDFQKVVDWWDKLDRNWERRKRYHEVMRNGSDFPLDYGAAKDGMLFPDDLNHALTRQVQKGDFLETIFYCPHELHELVSDAGISDILKNLKENQKELLFLWAVRLYNSSRIAAIRGQSDRNIRKIRTTMLKQIQKKLLAEIQGKAAEKKPLTLEEKAFLLENDKTALDGNKNG